MKENMSKELYNEYRKRKGNILYNKIMNDCNICYYFKDHLESLKINGNIGEELVKLFDFMIDNKNEIERLAKTIIDNEEVEYLINIVKPFSNRVNYIVKRTLLDNTNIAYISICYKEYDGETQCLVLPCFDINKHYIYMELGKEYTLEELGILFKEDPISIDITDNISTNIEDNTNKLVEEVPIEKDNIPSNNNKDTTVTYTVSKIKLSELDKSYLDPLYTSVIIDCGKERTHINYITKSDNKVSIWYYSPKSGMDMKSINIDSDYDFLNMENNKLYKPEEIDFEF
jgi:hypothetical protein